MPLRTRNKGVALGVSSHWLSNFVVVYVTPQAIDNLGYRLYIIWAALNASFVPITWLWYPETARRSLEDMDEVFLREKFGLTHTRSPGTRRADELDESDVEIEIHHEDVKKPLSSVDRNQREGHVSQFGYDMQRADFYWHEVVIQCLALFHS
ncbi:MAG: hypothetical protein Q9167_000495 [Letrouitia subvulpina]